MTVSKGITLFAQTDVFNYDISKSRRQPANLNKWAAFKLFFHCMYQGRRRVVTTAGKGGVHGSGAEYIWSATARPDGGTQ